MLPPGCEWNTPITSSYLLLNTSIVSSWSISNSDSESEMFLTGHTAQSLNRKPQTSLRGLSRASWIRKSLVPSGITPNDHPGTRSA